MEDFLTHVRAFHEDPKSMAYLEEMCQENFHDVVAYSLDIFDTPDTPDDILLIVCSLIRTGLRPPASDIEREKRIEEQRSLWFEHDNLELHEPLKDAMYRGLSHPLPQLQNICAANLAYFILLEQSSWCDLVGSLADNIDSDETEVELKHGSLKCLVEMFEMKVVTTASMCDIEESSERQLIEHILDLMRNIMSNSEFDEETRITATCGVIAIIQNCGFVVNTEATVNEMMEFCYKGLETSTCEIATRIHKVMIEMIKTNYDYVMNFLERLSELVNIGLDSDDTDFQVVAMDFWCEIAAMEHAILMEYGPSGVCGICGMVAIELTRSLCTKLSEVKDHTIDDIDAESRDWVFQMSLITMESLFKIAPQPVFEVISDYFMDCIESPEWEMSCGSVMALRCICDDQKHISVSEFLSEVIHWPIEYACNEEMNMMVRVESLKSIRTCLKYYDCILEDSAIFDQIMSVMNMIESPDLVIVKYVSKIISQFCRVSPDPEYVDSLFENIVPITLQLISNDEAACFIDIMLCNIIRHSSAEAGPTIDEWVPQLLEFLHADDLAENVGRCVCLIMKAIVDKRCADFPDFEAATAALLQMIGDDNERLCEEALMALSSLMVHGKKGLVAYIEFIWNKYKFALSTENEGLTNIVYASIGNLFIGAGSRTLPILEDVLDTILGAETPTQPLLICITCIEQNVGALIPDLYAERIIEIFQEASVHCDDSAMMCTVIRGYTMMFIGNINPRTATRRDSLLVRIFPVVMDFIDDLSKQKKNGIPSEILSEIYKLLVAIGKAMEQSVNVPLTKRSVMNLIELGESNEDDAKIRSDAKKVRKFLESL